MRYTNSSFILLEPGKLLIIPSIWKKSKKLQVGYFLQNGIKKKDFCVLKKKKTIVYLINNSRHKEGEGEETSVKMLRVYYCIVFFPSLIYNKVPSYIGICFLAFSSLSLIKLPAVFVIINPNNYH